MSNIIEQARALIGSGKTAGAIDILLSNSSEYPDLHAQLLMQAAKLKDISKKEMMGLISFDDAMMARNQVNYAVLEIIRELEQQAAQNAKKTVFISYNHADALVANKIKTRLQSEGIDVTIDSEEMGAGDDIKSFIEKCIRENETVLSLVSRKSLLSAWVAMESINTFYQEKGETPKKFIPCYIEANFFDQGFTGEAITEIDEKLSSLGAILKSRVEQNFGIDDISSERSRLLELKHNIDKIVGRLRNSLCIDIRDKNFEQGISKVIEKINN